MFQKMDPFHFYEAYKQSKKSTLYVFIKEQSPPLMGAQLYVPYQSPLYLESGGFGGGRGDFGNGGGGSKCYKCNRYYEQSTLPFKGTLSFTDVVIT